MAGRIRIIMMAVTIATLCGLLAAAAGCGGDPVPPPISITSTVSAADTAAAQAVKEMSDYTAALREWFDGYVTLAEHEGASALEFADPLVPSDSEVGRAKEFIEHMRGLVSDLKNIDPPADIAQAHLQLRSALSGELTALERYISALGWGSLRDVELAYRQAQESYDLMQRAISGLTPYVDLSGMIQN